MGERRDSGFRRNDVWNMGNDGRWGNAGIPAFAGMTVNMGNDGEYGE